MQFAGSKSISADEQRACQWALKSATPTGRKLSAALRSENPLSAVAAEDAAAAISEWVSAGRPMP